MDQRIVDFIAGLRAAGVRISISESQDAFFATESIGIMNQGKFRDSLRATLDKENNDRPVFDQLFPLYFGSGGPPMLDLTQDLSPEEKETLQQALRALLEQMRQQQGQPGQEGQQGQPMPGMSSQELNSLWGLLQSLLQGLNPSQDQLDQMGQQAGLPQANSPYQQNRMQNRMQRQLGMHLLEQMLKELAEQLQQMGMSQQAIDKLMEGMEQNREALADQIGQYVGAQLARQRAENQPDQREQSVDLMDRPFKSLSAREADLLRDEIRRLAAQLRSRAALRRKRAKSGTLDTKRTLRANLRYGGVPMELKFKHRHQKPKLVIICDMSTSMRNVVTFMLQIIYEMQDQMSSTHSFGFVSDLGNISEDFAEHTPEKAIQIVMARPDLQPGYYSTDLGNSLNTLMQRYAGTIDRRTTVVFVGDARNNYRNPRIDLMDRIKRRSKRVIWFNPEHPRMWGTGDSDMLDYLPYATAVHQVSSMNELTTAIDRLFTA